MFPLEGVLFPYGVMPLRIFEPRYRAMIELCLRGDGRFGVVLIERGSHVGGGDSRFDFGTVARIAEAARTPDGRYLLATVGTDRFRVKKWLVDDPYPRADIEIVNEPKRYDARAAEQRADIERQLVRVLALGAELGYQRATRRRGAPRRRSVARLVRGRVVGTDLRDRCVPTAPARRSVRAVRGARSAPHRRGRDVRVPALRRLTDRRPATLAAWI